MEREIKINIIDLGKIEEIPTPSEKMVLSKGVPIFDIKGFKGLDYVNIKVVEDQEGLKWQICTTIDNRR